ncbi:MAG TPA: hypothetical protein VJA16_23615 [Thermoanaerobaculia bacterium]
MPAAALPHRRPQVPTTAMRSWALSWVCALPWLLGAHPAPAQVPSLAFAQTTFQLDPRAPCGQATLVLTATPAVADAEIPRIEDAGGPGPSSVAVHFDAGKPQSGPKSTLWLVHATAVNVPPAISQPRLAHVTIGSQLEALVPYTLTNLSSSFRWTIQLPPTTWSLAAGREIPFAITVGPVTATGVHLVSCSPAPEHPDALDDDLPELVLDPRTCARPAAPSTRVDFKSQTRPPELCPHQRQALVPGLPGPVAARLPHLVRDPRCCLHEAQQRRVRIDLDEGAGGDRIADRGETEARGLERGLELPPSPSRPAPPARTAPAPGAPRPLLPSPPRSTGAPC